MQKWKHGCIFQRDQQLSSNCVLYETQKKIRFTNIKQYIDYLRILWIKKPTRQNTSCQCANEKHKPSKIDNNLLILWETKWVHEQKQKKHTFGDTRFGA